MFAGRWEVREDRCEQQDDKGEAHLEPYISKESIAGRAQGIFTKSRLNTETVDTTEDDQNGRDSHL